MDISDIFNFFLLGEGEGESEESQEGGEAGRGREGVCGKLGNWGGGVIFFFSGLKCPPRLAPSPIDLGEVQEFRHCTRVSGFQTCCHHAQDPGHVHTFGNSIGLSAPKSILRFAIAMPIADPRNR